jgi:malate dehydrogenase (oxaloacetate-decarboxylating)(NADP+)
MRIRASSLPGERPRIGGKPRATAAAPNEPNVRFLKVESMPETMHISEQEILSYHLGGKVGMEALKALTDQRSLSIAYTPGVARPCLTIRDHPADIFRYTSRGNLVAVVTDGTAVLGLGDIGPRAGIPVMEGKAVLFKLFARVDAWPVPLEHCRTGGDSGPTDTERLVDTAASLACMYGGINLEDIAAPACFEVEERLQERVDCPVFHDDQWGTAIITLAALKNYASLTAKALEDLSVVINGAGAAGLRIAETIRNEGVRRILLVDSKGVIHDRREDLNPYKKAFAKRTSKRTLAHAMLNADVFIGVSAPRLVTQDMVRSMAEYPAIFAMANPDPEIMPEEVMAAMGKRPYIIATGRSDYPNQINNVLGFPYIFRGALDVQAKRITPSMKKAASEALARVARLDPTDHVRAAYPDADLSFGPRYIIPKPFDHRLLVEVSLAVAEAACREGNASVTDLTYYRNYLEALANAPEDDARIPFIPEMIVRFGDLHTLCLGRSPEGVAGSFLIDPQASQGFVNDPNLPGSEVTLCLSKGRIVRID